MRVLYINPIDPDTKKPSKDTVLIPLEKITFIAIDKDDDITKIKVGGVGGCTFGCHQDIKELVKQIREI